MKVEYLGEDKYKVFYDNHIDIMTIDEIMFLLQKPEKKQDVISQQDLEEFWSSEAVYPRM